MTVFTLATIARGARLAQEHDSALMSTVAKSVALGEGWATHLHESVPFDYDVTTGPTSILPVAAAIRLVGNQVWVPNCASALLCGLLLAANLLCLARMTSFRHAMWLMVCFAPLLPLFIEGWALLYGEVPCALLLLLAAQLLAMEQTKSRSLVIGLVLALAVLAKAYALIPIAGMVAGWIALQCLRAQPDLFAWPALARSNRLQKPALAGCALILPWIALDLLPLPLNQFSLAVNSLARFGGRILLITAGILVLAMAVIVAGRLILFFAKPRGRSAFVRMALVGCGVAAGMLTLLGPWKLYAESRISEFPAERLAAYRAAKKHHFERMGSGIGQLKEASSLRAHLTGNFRRKSMAIAKLFDSLSFEKSNRQPGQARTRVRDFFARSFARTLFVLPLLCLGRLGWTGEAAKASRRPAGSLSVLIAAAACTHLLWFVLLSEADFTQPIVRYLQVPFVLSSSIVGLTIVSMRSPRARLASILVVIALSLVANAPQILRFYTGQRDPLVYPPHHPRLSVEAADFLNSHRFDGPLAGPGYGVEREIEFLLKPGVRMMDAYRVIRERITPVDGRPVLPSPVLFYWVKGPSADLSVNTYRGGSFLNYCPRTIWRNTAFQVLRCEIPPSAEELIQFSAGYRYRNWL